MSLVLITDSSGNPKEWVSYEEAACYYARGKVLWEIGTTVKQLNGGISAVTGEQSRLQVASILGVTGPLLADKFHSKESVLAERHILYGRDKHLCAYCGEQFDVKQLTIDHIHPKSKGGKNTWTNCVTACKKCNQRKGSKTLEQANMQLLYVPYVPNIFEKMILKNRKILADQMEFLLARVPKTSRLLAA
jgi:hypothetical protein